MRKTIDLNADLGEHHPLDGGALDRQLMPYLSSCNIACGGHAGDLISMQQTVKLALQHKVNIGAHPSYPDRENFGRKVMDIPTAILAQSLHKQIADLQIIVQQQGGQLTHVKPHGALYNLAADDINMAILICETIVKINPELALLGLAQSKLEVAAAKTGLTFWNEAFIDRRYDNSLRLKNRKEEGAVLNHQEGIEQLQLLIEEGKILTDSGKKVTLNADSLCLHSDTPDAIQLAHSISNYLKQQGVSIHSPI